MNRIDIERDWIRRSVNRKAGVILCGFLLDHDDCISDLWSDIWDTSPCSLISHFYEVYDLADYFAMSYLCRALSLNMLLDDNNVK